MKKKNILNRAMFRQVKSPAYGTGISANLVSNEQRQRYNYGGRVGFDIGSNPWKRIGSMADFDYTTGPYMPDVNLTAWNVGPGDPYEVKGDYYIDNQGQRVYDEEKTDFIPMSREKRKVASNTPYPKIYRDEDYVKSYLASEKAIDRKKALDTEDPTPGYGRTWEEGEGDDWRSTIHIPGTVRKKKIDDGGDGKLDPFEKSTIGNLSNLASGEHPLDLKENTEDIDTEPTAYETLMSELDKSAEEKKKLGRGNALMQAAAAAVEWSGAGTAKERSAAISKGLTKVGETAMKAATEGMDLKDKVKILKTMEDVKGEHKMDVWESKLDKYYKPSLKLQAETLQLKKDTIKKLEANEKPMAIYNEFLESGETNALKKAGMLYSLTDKKVPIARSDEDEKIYKTTANDGVIFIDKNNEVVRYVDGIKESVDEKTDKFFKWE